MRAIAAPPSTGSESGRPHASTRGWFARIQPRTAASSSARSREHGTASGSAAVASTMRAADEPDRRRPGAVPHGERSCVHEPCIAATASQCVRQRPESVSYQPGLLVAFLRGEGGHASLERSEEPARGGQGGDEPPDELSVALGIDAAVARSDAPSHVGQRARREPRPRPHGRGTPADRQGLFEGLLGQPGGRGGAERPEVRAAVARRGRAHDLQSRVCLGRIDLEVGVAAPGLTAPVVLRLVTTDQPSFDHEGLQLRRARHTVDRRRFGEQAVDLLALVAVEVRLHASAQVLRLADVQHAAVASAEQVDAGGVRQVIRQTDLAEMRPATGAHRFVEVAEREDAEPPAQVEQAVQHLGAGLGVGERPVVGHDPGAEIAGERLQLHVGDVWPDHAASQSRCADGRCRQRVVVEPNEVRVQEREVESCVVGHEHRAAAELEEGREDLLDRRLGRHRPVVDAGEVRDERRYRNLGVDQCLERTDPFAADVFDRSDLGDAAFGGGAPGGFEVHHAERDLVERDAQVERGLDGRGEHGFLRPVGPCGVATISNRCSSVKHRPPSWREVTTRPAQRWTRARA